MPKLNQIIAIEKGTKQRTLREVTDLYHGGQKADTFNGFSRVYTPRTEGGDQFPPENKLVQANAVDIVNASLRKFVELFDITATKDWANCAAKADIVVDGTVLLENAPVTYLLFLEQQVSYIKEVAEKLPTLAQDEQWLFDNTSRLHYTKPVETIKTAKVQEPLVLMQPTKEHPGQAQVITRDVAVGTWAATKFSGALPVVVKAQLLARIERLLEAIKFAREAANMTEAPKQEVGAVILNWIGRGVTSPA